MHQESSHLDLCRLRNGKIPLTGQYPISAFDRNFVLLYFGFLTRKISELDFNVFIRIVELRLSFKMVQYSSQSDTCNSRYSQDCEDPNFTYF